MCCESTEIASDRRARFPGPPIETAASFLSAAGVVWVMAKAVSNVNDEEDEAGRLWADGIAKEWADELDDPREDLYAPTDGLPIRLMPPARAPRKARPRRS